MADKLEKIKLGIVIVVYHSFERLVNYVKNELPKINKGAVTVIVNNASDSGECGKLAAACGACFVENADQQPLERASVYLIGSKENLGYSRGNNLGSDFLQRYFAPQYLLFSNDDISIDSENIINKLIEELKKRPGTKMIGPRVISHITGADQSPHMVKISPYRKIAWNFFPYLRKKRKFQNCFKSPESCECYWVSGAFFLIETESFFQVGKFDEEIFLYFEEVILAERLLKKNYKCYFYADVQVIHDEGASSQSISSFKRQLLLNSSCHYYRVYGNYSRFVIWLLQLSDKFNSFFSVNHDFGNYSNL